MGTSQYRVKVGLATCGVAAGGQKTYEKLQQLLSGLGISPEKTGCMGMCYCEPLVEVITPEGKSYVYGSVDEKEAEQIVRSISKAIGLSRNFWFCHRKKNRTFPYMEKQHRVLLGYLGKVNPESIDSYLSAGGYEAVKKLSGP